MRDYSRPRQGRGCNRRNAPRGDASTRAARGWVCQGMGARRPQELPVGDSRQYGASIEHVSAVRLAMPSGARGCAVAYAEAWEKVFREDGSSCWIEQRRQSRRSPVRFRLVHHWIAQLGRASVWEPSVAGSIPAPKHDLLRHDQERKFHHRKRPVRRSGHPRWNADGGARQQGRGRITALEADGWKRKAATAVHRQGNRKSSTLRG